MSDFKVAGKMSLDGSAFFSTMKGVRSSINGLGGMLAGAFSIGAITAFSKSVLDLAGNLKDVSDALNINVEYLQKFLNSAKHGGGSLEDIQKFLGETNKSRQAAVNDPNGKDAQAFGRLGFSAQDISQLNPQQFMDKMIEAFSGGVTPQKLNDIKEVGGKAAAKLSNGFAEGLSNNTIIGEDEINQLDEAGDKFQDLISTIQAGAAPAIISLVDALQQLVDWAEQHIAGIAALMVDDATDTNARNAQLADKKQKYQEQLDKRVAAGEITPERAKQLGQTIQDQSGVIADNPHDIYKQAMESAKAEQDAKKKARDDEREAQKAAKDEAAKASPDFQKNDTRPELSAAKTGASISSDSLTSVGNFLGSGATSSLESIGNQQLAVQQSIAEWTKRTHELLKNSNGIPAT